MDHLFEDESEFNEIIINRKQIELIVHKKFINDKHWQLFKTNFLYHFIYQSKKNISQYFDFIQLEYEDTKSHI